MEFQYITLDHHFTVFTTMRGTSLGVVCAALLPFCAFGQCTAPVGYEIPSKSEGKRRDASGAGLPTFPISLDSRPALVLVTPACVELPPGFFRPPVLDLCSNHLGQFGQVPCHEWHDFHIPEWLVLQRGKQEKNFFLRECSPAVPEWGTYRTTLSSDLSPPIPAAVAAFLPLRPAECRMAARRALGTLPRPVRPTRIV